MFKMISASALAGLGFVLVATGTSFAMEGGGGGGGNQYHYSRQKEREFQGDSATRTHRDGSATTSRETYFGDREVTERDGSKHKSRWNNRPWAIWTDTETGEAGGRVGGGDAGPRRDSATRHHPDGTETTSRADGNGGRDVTGQDGNTEKSRWTDKAWATWTDTNTGETGSWGAPPGR